jgi:hypothetical protein
MSKQTRHNRKKRQWLRDLKRSHGCEACGRRRIPADRLHFHHRNPASKSFDISRSVHSKSLSELATEIAKCAVYCEHCHVNTTSYGVARAA